MSDRKTFIIPGGHEAVRDEYGRATGQTRPMTQATQQDMGVSDEDLERFIRDASLKQFAFAKRALRIALELQSVRTATPAPEWQGMEDAWIGCEAYDECATEGCGNPGTVRFESGGVGSAYCVDCFGKVKALASPAQAIAAEGEMLLEALHFITNIDNAHPVFRKLRSALTREPS